MKLKFRWRWSILFVLGFICFYLFYHKYVPLTKPFQLILAPLLTIVFLVTILSQKGGLILFTALFPLANSLPYFFHLYTDIPQAPVALTLFLSFCLGWLFRQSFQPQSSFRQNPLFTQVVPLLLLMSISGFIAIFRFSNFFPFASDGFYEWKTNVLGVSAGGATMSTLFHFLNYLTGFIYFLLLFDHFQKPDFRSRITNFLMFSTGGALIFGLIQFHANQALGNLPYWHNLGQINATFSDPNAASGFLSAIIPFFLGLSIVHRKKFPLPLVLTFLALYILAVSGSRSAFLGLMVSFLFFIWFILRPRFNLDKKSKLTIIIFIVVFISSILFLTLGSPTTLGKRLRLSFQFITNDLSRDQLFNRRLYYWRAALAMMVDYPLSGVGVGAYIVELPDYLKRLNLPFQATDSALNYVFQVGAELGLTGLILLAFIALRIFRLLASTGKKLSAQEPGSLVVAGAMAGLSSFAVNFLFHTYIGSPEIKYLFWLLLAFVLSWKPTEAQIFLNKRSAIRKKFLLPLLIILINAASLLFVSTHSLSLGYKTRQFHLRQEFGLDRWEKTSDGREFRWSKKTAAFPLLIEKSQLSLPLHASHPDIHQRPVQVRMELLDKNLRRLRSLAELTLENNKWIYPQFDLTDQRGKEIIILIKVSHTWSPYQMSGIQDLRQLGIAIGKPSFSE